PGDFAPHPVEARQDHGSGRVVDYEVDSGQVLERADVATFPTDDPALHVVGGKLHHGPRRFGGVGCGESLHAHREDVADPPFGLALGLLLNLADATRGIVLGLIFDLLEQQLLGPGARHAGQAFELVLDLEASLAQHLAFSLQLRFTLAERILAARDRVLASIQARVALGDSGLQHVGRLAIRTGGNGNDASMRTPVESSGDHDSERDERCGADDLHGRSSPWTRVDRGRAGPYLRFLMRSDRAVRSVRRTEALQTVGSPFAAAAEPRGSRSGPFGRP